ncbi:STAS domain-containing protein [Streptomyces sp. NPDC046860]|uniref:STAS domain-containing protein n=1 Tax=Streptomyces sp. NPDC046860 TaxID=3154495 RepID=UPI00340DAF42
MFSVDVRQHAPGVLFVLCGELDFDSVVQLHEAADDELGRPEATLPVVVDCAALTFCDSSGISGLLRLYQRLSARGRTLRLAAVPASVSRLFTLTGLDQLFSVHLDAAEALAAGPGTPGAAAAVRHHEERSA